MNNCNICTYKLWPDGYADEVIITAVTPKCKTPDCAVIAFPGGAYADLAEYEGKDYACFFAEHGIVSFSVNYRVRPHKYPEQLSDARRAVQYVRANAEKYGINKDKIAVIGSSAGGHLAALLSTSSDELDCTINDNIFEESYMPNAQILCYPVICNPEFKGISHSASYKNLLGEDYSALSKGVDPCILVRDDTPQAFIWHTAGDNGVNVINSYRYAEHLKLHGIPVELHIFPDGKHGLGLAESFPHVAQWKGLLLNWLDHIGFTNNLRF